MRIAIVLSQFPLVSETFILQQIQGALARGLEVDIFAVAANGPGLRHPLFCDWQMAKHIRPRQAIGFGSIRDIAASLFRTLPALPAHPLLLLKCVSQSLRQRAGNPLLLFSAAVSIRNGKNTPTYDAIHAHFADLGLLAVRLRELGAIAGPIVTSFHGVDVTQQRSPKNRFALQQLFREGDLFTHPSDFLGERSRALGCPAERQRKLYYGVNSQKFPFKERKLLENQPVRIVSVARLVEKKGLQYAIAAVIQLIRNGRNISYEIIGDGPLRPALESLIREAGLEEKIRLLGAKDGESVQRSLAEAHIFLLPSVTAANGDMEGLPVSLLEAQMCGLPIVSTYHSGIPEGVCEGQSALLVPERDTDALAEKLGFLVDNPAKWPEMGRAGRAYVEETFEIEKLNDDLLEIYRSLRPKNAENVLEAV